MTKEIARREKVDVDTFRWKTMDGQILRIGDMKTSHVFNSMKMIFNHLAEANGGYPVWFEKKYSDYRRMASEDTMRLAATVIFFLNEIQKRGDLPERYAIPFTQILNQIKGIQRVADGESVAGLLA